MQSKITIILSLLFTLTIYSQQFVKITEGSHVNDGGDSRAVNLVDYDNDGYFDLLIAKCFSINESNAP